MSTASHQNAAPDDWDKHWSATEASNAMNPAQTYRRKLVFDALGLGRAALPERLLELGSGSGEFAREVTRLRPDAEIVGLDLSAVGVATAQRKVPGARFFQQDFVQPMKLDDSYRGWATHAVCSEVLEHLDDPTAVLCNVRPFLAPGCRLVITVPGGPMSAFDRHIGHRRHFTPELLEKVLREADFTVADMWCAGFPFFNLYRLTVIARGKKLIGDVAGKDESTLPLSARTAMRAFSWLFGMNTTKTSLGWQLVAVGVKPL